MLKVDNSSGNEAEQVKVKYNVSSDLEFVGALDSTGAEYDIPNLSEITLDKDHIGKEIYLVFKIKKANGRDLPAAIIGAEGLDVENEAEIIEYTSVKGGYVDDDSIPGNTEKSGKDGIDFKYEDDYNNYTVNFKVNKEKREISGKVAEAEGGALSTTGINNVTVQLIEKVKFDDTYLEYIWQETKTGSNLVKARRAGTNSDQQPTVYTYSNELGNNADPGTYQFLSYSENASDSRGTGIGTLNTGFIPGKTYIVRFIYGDGSVYDTAAGTMTYNNRNNSDINKYNGQDYKSTIDRFYTDEWYNKDNEGNVALTDINSKYNTDEMIPWSVARDNEARRLEVMAFSSVIDENLGGALSIFEKTYDADRYRRDASGQLVNEDYYREFQLIENYWNKCVDITRLTSPNPNEAFEQQYILYVMDKVGIDISNLDNVEDEQKFEFVKAYVLENTWMCAETSKIDVPISSQNEDTPKYTKVNFGLELRPQTQLRLEKHITAIKILTRSGKTMVDAKISDNDLQNYLLNEGGYDISGEKAGLSVIRSSRGERGFWKVETDIEEIAQGASLEVEYTYVLKETSTDRDYLSKDLMDLFVISVVTNDMDTYKSTLKTAASDVSDYTKAHGFNGEESIGRYLGQFYYSGTPKTGEDNPDEPVLTRVNEIQECLNNSFGLRPEQYRNNMNNNMQYFEEATGTTRNIYTYSAQGRATMTTWQGNNIIKTTEPSKFIAKPGQNSRYTDLSITSNDTNKKVWLTTVLQGSADDYKYPSYIAEITSFSNAVGRRNMDGTPANLKYANSDDKNMVLDGYKYTRDDGGVISYANAAFYDSSASRDLKDNEKETAIRLNELDEFWGEIIQITKPTGGEDKSFPMQTVIIATSAVVLLGAGIFLIKKFAIKK